MGGTAKLFDHSGKRLSYRHRYGFDESWIKIHNKAKTIFFEARQNSTVPWIYGHVSLGLGLETEFDFTDLKDFDLALNIRLGPTRVRLSIYRFICEEDG